MVSQRSQLLWDVLTKAYKVLGFDQLRDAAFQQLVLGRIIEPTSKADTIRVLDELGIERVSRRTLFASLARARERDYRTQIASTRFDHSHARGGLSLVLYDVTTLYFDAEKKDQLLKVTINIASHELVAEPTSQTTSPNSSHHWGSKEVRVRR